MTCDKREVPLLHCLRGVTLPLPGRTARLSPAIPGVGALTAAGALPRQGETCAAAAGQSQRAAAAGRAEVRRAQLYKYFRPRLGLASAPPRAVVRGGPCSARLLFSGPPRRAGGHRRHHEPLLRQSEAQGAAAQPHRLHRDGGCSPRGHGPHPGPRPARRAGVERCLAQPGRRLGRGWGRRGGRGAGRASSGCGADPVAPRA